MGYRIVFRVLLAMAVAGTTAATASSAGAASPDSVALVDPSTGVWHARDDGGGWSSFYYGVPGDLPFIGDWDCDGVDTPGLYRQSDGYVYLRNSNTQGVADITFFFGNPGDAPLAGDFDGDGCDTLSVYRPSSQTVFIIDRLGTAGGGLGAADTSYVFGNPGDTPFVGDFNGDGIDTVGLHRPSTGLVYFRNSHSQGTADEEFVFGDPGDRVVAGDWTGDGVSTPGLFRPSDTTTYLRFTNTQGIADDTAVYGNAGWIPVAGSMSGVIGTPDLELETVATGLDRPIYLTSAPGDPRLFVVEQTGVVRIIEDGAVVQSPFISITDRLSAGGERGLLGMAFHPGFTTNGRFFLSYTDTNGTSRISEFRADSTSDVADPATERVIMAVAQPAPNHNGGMITFGPDGYLYVGLGDGGGANDRYGNGQNASTLLGSILRIDVDGASPYTIPPTNPFDGSDGAEEAFVFGLRNPWRFSFDRGTGYLYVGDVGQDRREEITVLPPESGGANLGWNVVEGDLCLDSGLPCAPIDLTPPTIVYGRADGVSVTGGYVYRGARMPLLTGTYFYGDFGSGMVRSMRLSGGLPADQHDWTERFAIPGYSLASFGEDGVGELYVVLVSGTVARIVQAR